MVNVFLSLWDTLGGVEDAESSYSSALLPGANAIVPVNPRYWGPYALGAASKSSVGEFCA